MQDPRDSPPRVRSGPSGPAALGLLCNYLTTPHTWFNLPDKPQPSLSDISCRSSFSRAPRSRAGSPPAYGADHCALRTADADCGSPPRVRSRPPGSRTWRARRRLTSARAEQTAAATVRATPGTAHLRACGADFGTTGAGKSRCDSPPRMRSGRRVRPQQPGRVGLTSAHAERTSAWAKRVISSPTHLHACGADRRSRSCTGSGTDSPPRMRSGHRDAARGTVRAGLTSAHAERTSRASAPPPAEPTHLRACGADRFRRLPRSLVVDSPPRMRSGRRAARTTGRPDRLTSAHAERT